MKGSVERGRPGAMPLPERQFSRFINVFHLIFIAGLLFTLFLRWNRIAPRWLGVDGLLVLLLAAQIVLYLRFFAKPEPVNAAWLAYFLGAFGIWFLEWYLDPGFIWVGLAVLGQVLGVAPPRISVPVCTLTIGLYLARGMGWDRLAQMNGWEWFSIVVLSVSGITMGLFLHKLTVTSAERAELIEQLRTAQRELEAARATDAELAALRERERLARELHDSLGHSLVTLSVQLEAARRLVTLDPSRACSLLEQNLELTRSGMEQLRRSLAGLRTPGLGDRPLPAAVDELLAQFEQRVGWKAKCRLSPGLEKLPPSVAECAWRIVQEGLANIERHADASEAGVEISPAEGLLWIRVSDNGRGLQPDLLQRQGHYGIRGLRERVEGLGGDLSLTPNHPCGTVLEARIPVFSS